MSSRQRLLTALKCQESINIPCSFMLYKGLLSQSSSYLEFIQRQIDIGLDVFVQIPPRHPLVKSETYNLHGLPVHFHPSVSIREWKQTPPDERWPILHKEYHTPAGNLLVEIYQDNEWPYGNHIPFLDDYIETRSRKFLITSEEDLEALRYLLVPPNQEEIDTFHTESKPVLNFARHHDLLVTGGWGVGADLIGWIFGLQNMMFASFDQPEFLQKLLKIIADWNLSRMRVLLEAGIDLFIKRAWYENCDFWSPLSWKKFIYPILKADVEMAHSYGANFGYLITSNCMPLLDLIADCGVNALIGVDPERWNLTVAKEKLAGKVCLWGGVNGHQTIEQGNPEQVRGEVRVAIEKLAPGGGFILSPVDNVRENSRSIQSNVTALIDEWQRIANTDNPEGEPK